MTDSPSYSTYVENPGCCRTEVWGDGSSEFGPASPCDIAHDGFLSETPLSFLTVQSLGWQPGPSNRNMGLGMAKGVLLP